MLKIKKVVLIEPRSPGIHFFSFAKMPRLGLPILGAILKKMNLKVKIFCENLAPINWQEIAKADLIGISVLTNIAPRAYEIAAKIKEIAQQIKRKIPIVMGGPHPTFLPEEALENGADFVIRHEGEETLRELVEYLQSKGSKDLKDIPGISYREDEEIHHNPDRALVKDLDAIPLPDFSLIEGSERINFVPLQTSRGCPHDCEFCSVVQMFGKTIRYRSPESIIEEMKRTNPKRHIFVNDDNFSADPKRTLVLLEEMKRAKIYRHWSTQETVAIAWKKEVMKLMRETGCFRLYQGLESFNPQALKEWRKPQTPEKIEEAISILHRYGFLIHGMFVLGSDFDTLATIRKTVDLALRYGIDTAQFFILVPPPGTRLYRKLKEEDRIIDQDWSHYNGHYVVFSPRQMTPWQLQELAIEASLKFYTLWHGIKWALKGKGRNAFFAFYGKRVIQKWLKENKEFLAKLKNQN